MTDEVCDVYLFLTSSHHFVIECPLSVPRRVLVDFETRTQCVVFASQVTRVLTLEWFQ